MVMLSVKRSQDGRTFLGLLLVACSTLLRGFHGNSCDPCKGLALQCLQVALENFLLFLHPPCLLHFPSHQVYGIGRSLRCGSKRASVLPRAQHINQATLPGCPSPTRTFLTLRHSHKRTSFHEGQLPSNLESTSGKNLIKLNKSKIKFSCVIFADGIGFQTTGWYNFLKNDL